MDSGLVYVVLALRGGAAVAVLVTLVGGLPQLVRLGLVVLLGLWSATIAGAAMPGPVAEQELWLIGAREVVIGASIGVIAALPLLIAGLAGQLVDVAGGVGRAARGRGPYRALFGVLAAAVFVGVDGHATFVAAIADSFGGVPVAAAGAAGAGAAGPAGSGPAGLLPQGMAVLAALGRLVPFAVRLAVPWLVTAAVVEIAAGAASRIAGRVAGQGLAVAAAPAALVMMTASLVGMLAVAIAQLVR